MQYELPNYKIQNKIYTGNSLVFEGQRVSDSLKVILKFPAVDYPTPVALEKLRKEFQIGNRLSHPSIVKYLELLPYRNGMVIVMENIGAVSLSQYLKNNILSLENFLNLAIFICDVFHFIHLEGVIHKDIKPENIIINPDNLSVQVIDFGIASDVGRDTQSTINLNVLAGTLAYISPEQTGRMNRSIDNRSDIYSLGITFYEILAGKPPFVSTDSLEMLHYHIAKPAPPMKNNKVPSLLEKVIQKMISKNPEDRYKSCLGIQRDLQYILSSLKNGKPIDDITLGVNDYSTTLLIPEKLYGRSEDIFTLNKVFAQAANGSAKLLFVSGYSGIGKSGLIREVQKPLVAEKGYFISGKFDQFQKNVPYKGFIIAFQDFISQLLASGQSSTEHWKQIISNALSGNGKVLTDIIPDLELLIGKQPDIIELDSTQSQNRLNVVFENFVKCIASKQNPLVLFLDDLQWADNSSLNLLEIIFSGTDIQGLLVIGAFRDNEVDNSHPLSMAISNISKSGVTPASIKLNPLTLNDVTEFVRDCLSSSREVSEKLGAILFSKTAGNPFFLKLLLQNMYVNRNINQDKSGQWIVDFEKITTMQITDNVIDLAIKKINGTAPELKKILCFASCIGYVFDLDSISILFNKSKEEILNLLKEGLKEELITKQESNENVFYRFIHDRIQQAYYSLLSENELIDFHNQIGNYLLKSLPQNKIEEEIFEITNHLNKGLIKITSKEDYERLLELNLRAGAKAKISAAYEASQGYYRFAVKCLDKLSLNSNTWEHYYAQSFEAYSKGAEVSLLAADFENMLKLSEVALAKTKTLLDRVRIFEIQINYHSQINDLEKAVGTSVEILKELGVVLPEKAKLADIFLYLFKTKIALGKKKSNDLYNLKTLDSPELSIAMKIIMSASSAAYFTSAEMLSCMILKAVAISAKSGNSNYSIYFYAGYGLILCGALFDLKGGNEFADLSIQLLDKYNANELRCRVVFLVHAFSHHWMHNLRDSLSPLLNAYKVGLENGDLEYASGAILFHRMYSLNLGEELISLEKDTRSANAHMLKTKQFRNRNTNLILHQVMLNLLGESDVPYILKGESFDGEEGLKIAIDKKDIMAACWILLYQSILFFLFGKHQEAYTSIVESEKYEPGILAQYLVVLKNFYSSLIIIANVSAGNLNKSHLKKVKSNQKKLKSWMKSFSSNIEHKYYLVEAELARVFGNSQKASEFYETAVELSEKNGFVNECALTNELAGNFYSSEKKYKFAKIYYTEARFRYLQWGAKTKVQDIETKIPSLSQSTTSFSTGGKTVSAGGATVFAETKNSTMAMFDMFSMMKASQSLSGEIQLERLLEKLIHLAVENAGAEKGFLVIIEEGKMLIQAYLDIPLDRIEVLKSLPIQNYIPETIVSYTISRREPLVLDNASKIGNFTKDSFVISNQTLSVLCVPLIHQGKLNGLIYLENNKTGGAFTPDRVDVLRTLSSQASISIENATLYENLSVLNKAYERFVPKQFIETLGKKNVIEVKLGDNVSKKATIFFSDIRSFTTLSEQMSPEENFRFINSYLKHMEPIINQYSGFIDKYIGDAIMALFPSNADDALDAAINMQKALVNYNAQRKNSGYIPIEVGMGLNTGDLILGTVGGEFRMDGTVISDSVNLASRIEGLTKYYGASILISENTLNELKEPNRYKYRYLGIVRVKGKSKGVGIIEILDGKPKEELNFYLQSMDIFNNAWTAYTKGDFKNALQLFEEVISINPKDKAASLLKNKTLQFLKTGVPKNWDGIEEMESK